MAVDSSEIPLGSLLEVEGFDEPFAAEDTGAAVRGRIIELWFPDAGAALAWGNQRRRVTVLRVGP